MLRALNDTVTTGITVDDVTGVWAGLRPLVKSVDEGRTADLSRRHRVTTGPAGVVAITGGKLTTYREMAQDTVDVVIGAPRPQGSLEDQAPSARSAATATSRRRTAPPTSTSASATAPWQPR